MGDAEIDEQYEQALHDQRQRKLKDKIEGMEQAEGISWEFWNKSDHSQYADCGDAATGAERMAADIGNAIRMAIRSARKEQQ